MLGGHDVEGELLGNNMGQRYPSLLGPRISWRPVYSQARQQLVSRTQGSCPPTEHMKAGNRGRQGPVHSNGCVWVTFLLLGHAPKTHTKEVYHAPGSGLGVHAQSPVSRVTA